MQEVYLFDPEFLQIFLATRQHFAFTEKASSGQKPKRSKTQENIETKYEFKKISAIRMPTDVYWKNTPNYSQTHKDQ